MAPRSLIGTWELSTVLEQRIDKMGSNIEKQETDTNRATGNRVQWLREM